MKQTLLLTLAVWITIQTGWAQNNSTTIAYIAQYKTIAMKEMKRTGVPASITLAQATIITTLALNVNQIGPVLKPTKMMMQNKNVLELTTQLNCLLKTILIF
jgi:hypothetical protein